MKVKDLMIGDLVRITDPDKYEGAECRILSTDNREGAYYRVFIDDGAKYGCLEYEVFKEDIAPIFLTPEILEKNGFEMTKQEKWWSEWKFQPENGGRTIFITNINCINGGYDFGCYRDGIFVDFFNIKYVHELQHALKLCGIEKEIIL